VTSFEALEVNLRPCALKVPLAPLLKRLGQAMTVHEEVAVCRRHKPFATKKATDLWC
jgi:hypothetical protein